MCSFIFLKNCHVSFLFFLTENTCYLGKKDFNQNFTEPKPVAWVRASFSLGDRAAPKAHTRSTLPARPPTALQRTALLLQERYSSLTKESGATLQNPAPPLTSSGALNSYLTPPSFSFLSNRIKKITVLVFHRAVRTQ